MINTTDDQRTPIHQSSLSHLVERCYDWMCKRRAHHHHNQSIWDVMAKQSTWRQKILGACYHGRWQFSPTRFVKLGSDDECVELWSAEDAWLLKIIALMFKRLLSKVLSKHCYHVAGGSKCLLRKTLRWIQQHGTDQPLFVYKTDVRSYYQSIQHHILLHQLADLGISRHLLNLIWRYLTRLVDINANLVQVDRGIPKGCSLSPILSALYLTRLDQVMTSRRFEGKLFYGRFQDDWVILSTSRWALKRAIRQQHEILQQLNLELRPEKTFMGYATKGFDFLGYHIQQVCGGETTSKIQYHPQDNHLQQNTLAPAQKHGEGYGAKTGISPRPERIKSTPQSLPPQKSREVVTISLSKNTYDRFQKKRIRLYEQKATDNRLGAYIIRFEQWAKSGFNGIVEVKLPQGSAISMAGLGTEPSQLCTLPA